MKQAWKIAPGKNAWARDREEYSCLRSGCIAISWLNDTDLTGMSPEEIIADFDSYDETASGSAKNSIWRFVNEVKKGDVVVANKGESKAIGLGIVTSGYLSPGDKRNPHAKKQYFRQVRLVDWRITDSVSLRLEFFHRATVNKPLTSDQCAELRDAYLSQVAEEKELIREIFRGTPTDIIGESDATPDEWSHEFIPQDGDLREIVTHHVRARRGQRAFREKLRERYRNQCVVTACELADILEAAHIKPYRGNPDNNPQNGLLLRADIHTLFDLNLIGINPTSLRIELHPKLQKDNHYGQLAGTPLNCPNGRRPSKPALIERYREFRQWSKIQ